jgi:uncharacterized protein YdbL (DUF1318 family)
MKPAFLFRLVFLGVALLLGAAVAQAEDLGALKARMEQRQGSVDALKDRKLVGENNRGYLEPRASLTPSDEKIMSDENEDRRQVYGAIAAKTGASADEVGRARAQKIAISSKRGVWVQSPDGSWSEKM